MRPDDEYYHLWHGPYDGYSNVLTNLPGPGLWHALGLMRGGERRGGCSTCSHDGRLAPRATHLHSTAQSFKQSNHCVLNEATKQRPDPSASIRAPSPSQTGCPGLRPSTALQAQCARASSHAAHTLFAARSPSAIHTHRLRTRLGSLPQRCHAHNTEWRRPQLDQCKLHALAPGCGHAACWQGLCRRLWLPWLPCVLGGARCAALLRQHGVQSGQHLQGEGVCAR